MIRKSGFKKAFVLLAMLAFSMAIAACGGGGGGTQVPTELQDPVFLGFTFSTYSQSEPRNATSEPTGDHNARDNQIDQENPFDSIYGIEDVLSEAFELPNEKDVLFYAEQSQKLKLTVNLSNPSELDIVSITIDGEKITANKFIDPSDKKNPSIIKTANNVSGYQTFEITEIRYAKKEFVYSISLDEAETVATIGVKAKGSVSANVRSEAVLSSQISFIAMVTDSFNLIQKTDGFFKAVLYDGVEIVDSVDIEKGETEVVFKDLTASTKYQYAIIAYLDGRLGTGAINEQGIMVLRKRAFYTNAEVLFNFNKIVIDKTSIKFDFVWDASIQDKTIKSLKLLREGENSVAISGTNITGLLSGTAYTIVAEYKDNHGVTKSISISFETAPILPPSVEVINLTADRTSLKFDIKVTDEEKVGFVSGVEIIKGGEVVFQRDNITSLKNISFDKLLSDTTYTVRVVYSYDQNDDKGLQTVDALKNIKTLSFVGASLSFRAVSSSSTSVEFDFNIIDSDGIGQLKSISVLKDDNVVLDVLNLNERIISGLEPHTKYTLKAEYEYDLNTGEGMKIATATYSFATLADVYLAETKIMNTSAVSVNETVYLEVKLNNERAADITRIEINGIMYEPTIASTHESFKFDFVVDESYSGGTTNFVVTSFYYLDRLGKEHRVETSSNNSASVFINGEMYVKDLWIVDENLNRLEYYENYSTFYYYVELNNSTGYRIDEIVINWNTYYSTDFTTLANGDVLVPRSNFSSGSSFKDSINRITYWGEQLGSKSKDVSGIESQIVMCVYNTVMEVRTADDLKNMSNNQYYELKNDIDLSGIEWIPNSFNGVFNGNGYKIKNMSRVATIEGTTVYQGLFTFARGIINDLVLDGANFIIESPTDGQGIYAGVLAAQSEFLILNNVSVTSSAIIAKKTNAGEIHVGGLLGKAYNFVEFNNCHVEVNISQTSDENWYDQFAGGLIGYTHAEHLRLIDCSVKGVVSGKRAGGLIGIIHQSSSAKRNNFLIENCAALNTVTGKESAGGFIAELHTYSLNEAKITKSYATGNVEANEASGFACNIYANGNMTIEDCYASGNVTALYRAAGFVGSANGVSFINCYALGNVSGGDEVGGFVGYYNINDINYSVRIEGCYALGNIVSNSNYAGGFVGSLGIYNNTSVIIRNNYALGSVNGLYSAGGFAGQIFFNGLGKVIIENCYAAGQVNGSEGYYMGGFVGTVESYFDESSDREFAIRNCFAVGSIKAYSGGYFVGSYNYSGSVFENCYRYSAQTFTGGSPNTIGASTATAEKFNDASFYINTLKFDSNVWDFSFLDLSNNRLPTLKK